MAGREYLLDMHYVELYVVEYDDVVQVDQTGLLLIPGKYDIERALETSGGVFQT